MSNEETVDWRGESRELELESALTDQALFITRLSHEMRSPLHAIQGLAEVLLESDGIDADDRRHIKSIDKESAVLRRLIDDLLDMSKMGAGQMELVADTFTPAALCDEIGLAYRPRAELKGLDLRVSIDPAVPRIVVGDRHRVRQILVNLVSNAIKYTDAGEVSLHLEAATADAAAGHTAIRFIVRDTGRGIPDDMAPYIFDPYRQLDAADTATGTGIGLTITRMFADLMGGSIWFDSTPAGTTFTCELPFRLGRRDSDRGEVAKELAVKGSSDATQSILVVDDSEVNRLLAAAQLKRLGRDATLVSSGAEALDLLNLTDFDFIFMDWHMPGIDGLETTRQIRALGDLVTQPRIIATTASVMSGDREQCLAAGMDDYLAKPVSLTDLAEMLDRWAGSTGIDEKIGGNTAVDEDTLDRLVEELGDSETAHSILLTFLSELGNWRSQMTDGVEQGDIETARRAAHTVKSTASMLGATELAQACAVFESDANDSPDVGLLLERVLVSADSAHLGLTEQAERLRRN